MKKSIKIIIMTALLFNCASVNAGFLWDIFVGYFFVKGLLCGRDIIITCEHCKQCVQTESNSVCAYCGNSKKNQEQKDRSRLKKQKARKAKQVYHAHQNQEEKIAVVCTDMSVI